jgi:hypothetical protein
MNRAITASRLLCKHSHDRLCWVIQKSVDQRSCLLRLKASEAESIPPVQLTPMALEIDHRDFTNSVHCDGVVTRASIGIGSAAFRGEQAWGSRVNAGPGAAHLVPT